MLSEFRERRLDVITALSELAALAGRVGARSLGVRVDEELVQKLEADRFHLVVVGEFNHGKSTFVNALLGAPILPVGVTPTTAVIHHLEHAEAPSARVVHEDGRAEPIAFEEVRRFALGGPERPVERNVKFLEVGYPAELLRERIVLVDTPGVNDLSLQRADITYSYIPRSDAVLFLLDAGQPLKESERVFLEQKLLGQSRDKIVFVVSRADIWSEEEAREAIAYIRAELAKIVPAPVVFPVSAQRHLAGDAARSGMSPLAAHLSRFLAEERGRILLDNALGEGIAAASVLRKGVDARRRAARMGGEELERRIDLLERDLAGQSRTIEERRGAIREEISAIRAWVRRDLDRMCDDVARQLPALIDQASAEELKTHLGPFLESTFVAWASAENAEIAAALEALAERTIVLVREDARDVARRVAEALGGDVRAPDVTVDTFAYDVGVFALFTVGLTVMLGNVLLGGLLALAAPVLAVFVKESMEAETRRRARELAPAAMREAAARVGPKLDEMIEDFARRLDAWVVTAGEELHREVIEVLAAARGQRRETVAEREEMLASCEAQGAELARVEERLHALRAALWLPAAAVEAPAPTNGAAAATA